MSPCQSHPLFVTYLVVIVLPWQLPGLSDSKPVSANDQVRQTTATWENDDPAALCGIHCLYTAADAVGKPVLLSDLIEPEFVSHDFGSSTFDLLKAASSIGLRSKVLSGVSLSELSSVSVPAILHVQSRRIAGPFDHWALYLGKNEDGSYRILDPNFGMESMSSSTLASRFDGSIILVGGTNEEIGQSVRRMFFNRAVNAICNGAWLLAAFVFVSLFVQRGKNAFRRGITLFIVAVTGGAFLFHWFSPVGLLVDSKNVSRRMASHSRIDFPRANLDSIIDWVRSPDEGVILIDARYAQSFRTGTITGAINYPLNISEKNENGLLEEIRKTGRVVVFCQGKNCNYDELVARRLHYFGVRDISIYEGGVTEWELRLASSAKKK